MSIPYPITIDAGADFEMGVLVRLADGTTPESLEGYSARAQVRNSQSNVLAGDFVCVIDNPLLGSISVKMPNQKTSLIGPTEVNNSYFWDLEIYTTSNAIVRRLIGGLVTVTKEATK